MGEKSKYWPPNMLLWYSFKICKIPLPQCTRKGRVSVLRLFKMPSSTFPTILSCSRYSSTIPPAKKYQTQELVYSGKRIVGEFGRCYVVEQILQEKGNPPRHVYLARYGNIHRKACFSFNLLITHEKRPEQEIHTQKCPLS